MKITNNNDLGNNLGRLSDWSTFCFDVKTALDKVLLKYVNSKVTEIKHKINVIGNDDIVTSVDEEIEVELRNLCRKHYPQIPFVGEESYTHDLSVFESPILFIVDPIDGTTQLAKGENDWSISLGVSRFGKPYAAILYVPSRDRFYTSIRGNGVVCNGQEISNHQKISKSIAVSPHQFTFGIFQKLISNSLLIPIRIPSLTIKIVALLSGEVDAAVYFPQEGKCATIWDYAAVNLLIEEFGGKMTSLDGNNLPFRGEGIIHKHGWLATTSDTLHTRLHKIFNQQPRGRAGGVWDASMSLG
jgi:myo-inositol-1(or 4)-monophosphatase